MRKKATIDESELKKMYEDGEEIQAMADYFHVHKTTIERRIKAMRKSGQLDEGRRGYRGIDEGKVMALHRAGWTDSDIASDVHKPVELVVGVIKAHKNSR